MVKVGVYFGGITSDMTKEVIEEHDLLYGVQTVMTLWQWSELFLKNGFRLASVSPQSLERVWRIETKANEGDLPVVYRCERDALLLLYESPPA